MNQKNEYSFFQSLVLDEYTIDSPLWPIFGELLHLLKKELDSLDEAKKDEQEIVHKQLPIEGTSKFRSEITHSKKDPFDILIAMNSQATEGIACAVIIMLANNLRSISNSFNVSKTYFKVCPAGEKMGSVYWADLVVVASNYVRHGDEWVESANSSKPPNDRQEKNLIILESSGLLRLDAWYGKLSYIDLLRHLQADTWDNLVSKYSSWLRACLPFHPGHKA